MPLDLTAASSLVAERLPASSRWFVLGVHLDWSFSTTFRRVEQLDLGLDSETTTALRPFVIFGEHYFDGGASPLLAVHEDDGTVHGIDVERDSGMVFAFNSALADFVETFLLLDPLLRNRGAVVSRALLDDVRGIDPGAFDQSDWSGLLNALGHDEE